MLRLVSLVAVTAAVLVLPTAQAAQAPVTSLSASAFQVRYGNALTFAGRVSDHQAGVPVSVFSRPFTKSGFARVATVTTDADGRWAVELKPSIATAYQARLGGRESRTLSVAVRPALSLVLLDNGGLWVDVAAGRSLAGRSVKLQRLESGSWTTLAKLRLNGASRAFAPRSVVPLERATVRATMSVNQAGQGYLGGFAPPVVLPARWVSLSLSSSELVAGDPVQLSGVVSLKQPGQQLSILARPAAKPEFQPLAQVTTVAGGRWSFSLQPRIGTIYKAQFAGASSRALGVGVHPDVTVRIVSDARVLAHVGGGRWLAGRQVKIQQLSEGEWHTLGKRTLNGRLEAVFPTAMLPGGVSTLRIVMSVNQAGPGYLGASSPSFVYQR